MKKKLSAGRIAAKAVKAMFYLVIFSVNAFILWRIFASGDPAEMKTILVNEHILAAYETEGENLTMFSQEQNSITRAENNAGYFSITDAVFIPEAHQVQIVFRYNNSTIRALVEDYGLEALPSREETLYDVTLLVNSDLTPENTEDNLGNDPVAVAQTRYYPSAVVETTKNMYNYRKYIFDDVDVTDLTLAVFADIYYIEDIDYEKDPYGVLCLYDFKTPSDPRRLTRDDIEAIERFRDGT